MAQTECYNCGYPWAVKGGKCPNCGHDNCFITTAVCTESGLPDSCRELTVLRAFRDRYMTASAERLDMLAQYYSRSPDIVARINASPERAEIYRELRQRFINPAVEAAERGDDALAEQTYVEGMNWIVQRV